VSISDFVNRITWVLLLLLLRQVGYSLNALVDFPPSDPISIIKHLMVGSEGTLGFVSNVTYNNVPQAKHSVSIQGVKASKELTSAGVSALALTMASKGLIWGVVVVMHTVTKPKDAS
jgi:FAD/FMN-containing dehydrogenase